MGRRSDAPLHSDEWDAFLHGEPDDDLLDIGDDEIAWAEESEDEDGGEDDDA